MNVQAFVPNYDSCTQANANLANKLPMFSHGRQIVHGASATRSAFWQLVRNQKPIIVLSHGDYSLVCAQGGKEYAIALADVKNNLDDIRNRNMFVWACRTSVHLGREFRRHPTLNKGGIWWGYPVTVSAPDTRVMNDFITVFSFIVESFHHVSSVEEALNFREALRDLCVPIYSRVVKLAAESRQYKDLHETAVAFREVHEYLDVSFANGERLPSQQAPLDQLWK